MANKMNKVLARRVQLLDMFQNADLTGDSADDAINEALQDHLFTTIEIRVEALRDRAEKVVSIAEWRKYKTPF